MADTKISALTGATTPLAGTEVVPVVQGGQTRKVSIANLTAGRAVAMAGGSFTDNITQGTAAKGVNFTANTPKAGMTSQLLNAYEEGTFTATLTSATPPTTPPTVTSRYTKIGQQVTVTIRFNNVNTTGAAGRMRVTGLPFTSGSILTVGPTVGSDLITTPCVAYTLNSTDVYFVNAANEADIAIVAGTGRYLAVTLTYFV